MDGRGVEHTPAPVPSALGGISRWQKVVAMIGLAVVVFFGIRIGDVIIGSSGHGPGGDTPAGDVRDGSDEGDQGPRGGGHRPPPGVPDHG